ncbi:transglycosylase domain-containing protein [Sphingobacterium sp. UT-1RO-CII-1]|uniref:transglycosylase domain-containing protein n=1 Tax=Sphingobacterium sp. UT-1RO-CII-1 TaxID=2995225 RepID=UPI00227CD6D5|nr:biosynthetic peptidoglycan transglycosylase [Sphingobacterium sp. UT-1RO-CII-1]MCY4781055.1 transglycosylase domain-containing protein [Sphingobacterium sp. UT-1RO-CII-1]
MKLKDIQEYLMPYKKVIWIALGVLVGLLALSVVVGLSIRKELLSKTLAKVERKFRDDYAIVFKVEEARFSGLNSVSMRHVELLPDNREKLADIGYMEISIQLWSLLFGEVKVGNLQLHDTQVSFVKRDSLSNYDFLFRKKQQDSTVAKLTNEQNYAALLESIIKEVFFKIPRNMEVKNFELSYRDDYMEQRVHVPDGLIDDGEFRAALFLNNHEAQWNLTGHVNSKRQQMKLVVSSEKENVELPFLKGKYGLSVSFDELVFDLEKVKRQSRDSLTLAGSWSFANLSVEHRRLSEQKVSWPEASGQGQINIGKSSVEIDPESTVKVKDFVVHPHIRYDMNPEKVFSLAVHTGYFEAQKLFDAIPSGLFNSVEGIEVQGQVAYDLDFKINIDNPDSLSFSSKIDDKQLKIVKWGALDPTEMNGAFVYKAYEDSVLMREIVVGRSNPKFTALEDIAPVLRKSVLNTEDPNFFQHKGFEEEAFKLSLITNVKEKAFKRGASTISMQLVKNVFLNRNKTMMRKFEEVLLVWLIENSGEVSKERMYEVYLNVIEWGKNIYGIQEAAQYYFAKAPSMLTLGESLYLASIVPRPKTGLSSFDYSGHLKPWLQRYFNTYGSIMAKRGQLEEEEMLEAYGFYQVQLREALRPPRPAGVSDSLEAEDIEAEQEAIIKELEKEERLLLLE